MPFLPLSPVAECKQLFAPTLLFPGGAYPDSDYHIFYPRPSKAGLRYTNFQEL